MLISRRKLSLTAGAAMLAGFNIARAQSDSKIILGQSAAFTGPAAQLGRPRLQHHPLDRHAERRPFRRDGRAGSVRGRRAGMGARGLSGDTYLRYMSPETQPGMSGMGSESAFGLSSSNATRLSAQAALR